MRAIAPPCCQHHMRDKPLPTNDKPQDLVVFSWRHTSDKAKWCACERASVRACVFAGKSVKMAVLIRRRIRAVVFNQSGHWQDLRGSTGDGDDDSRCRGKHQKYTRAQNCCGRSRVDSATWVLRAALQGKEAKLQKRAKRHGHAAGVWGPGTQQVAPLPADRWSADIGRIKAVKYPLY